jgi:hypothetical protein
MDIAAVGVHSWGGLAMNVRDLGGIGVGGRKVDKLGPYLFIRNRHILVNLDFKTVTPSRVAGKYWALVRERRLAVARTAERKECIIQ